MSTKDRQIGQNRDASSVAPPSFSGPTNSHHDNALSSKPSNGPFDIAGLSGISSATTIPAAPSISLPKGGGAISGMGEKFDVDQATGTGSVTIPIQVPQSRSTLQPQLSLSYNSGAGNGEFGLSWRLQGYNSISRKTSKGVPQYDDRRTNTDQNADVFLLSDAEDLVPVFRKASSGQLILDDTGRPLIDDDVTTYDNYVVRKYVPRVMQSFSRIERWTNKTDFQDIHWRVITPENRTVIFGADKNSRIYDPASTLAQPKRIFAWLQCEEYDCYGNAVVYEYKAENSENVPVRTANEANRTDASRSANRYLKTIKYGNILPNRDPQTWIAYSPGKLSNYTWKFWLVLDYGDHAMDKPSPQATQPWLCRPDPFSRCNSGFEVRTYRLCQRILIFHYFADLGTDPVLVASVNMSYDHQNSISVLQSVKRHGYSFESPSSPIEKELPALEFGYQTFSPQNATLEALDVYTEQNIPIGIDQSTYRLIDMDGEGLPGILTEDQGTWYYKRNVSANNTKGTPNNSSSNDSMSPVATALFGPTEVLRAAPSLSLSGPTQAYLSDISGSGKLDVIQRNNSSWGYFERDLHDPSGWAPFTNLPSFPNIDATNKGMKFVDLTGDGLVDVVICDDQIFTWYPSLGKDGYGPPTATPQPSHEEEGPVCLYSDFEQCVYLADMSGDGLCDIVRIRNADICYWPSLGYGKFGPLVRMDNAPVLDQSDAFHESRIRLADFDGSGTTDILYLTPGGLNIYLNLSGNAFSDRLALPPMFPVDDTASVEAADLLGNGTTCILWSSSLPSLSRLPLRYLDLCMGRKPYLLNKIVNNFGAEKYLHYAPSTKFYLDDMQNGIPWISGLPFPVHCVERVEIVDVVSQTRCVQRYAYHHGYFDGIEREFRGFARTDVWDTEGFAEMKSKDSLNIDTAWHVPPVRTSTWFHTGIYYGHETWSQHLELEYFRAPSNHGISNGTFLGSLLPDTKPPSEPLKGSVLRECYRALKGHPLRKEVYGEDGTSKAAIPYMIEEHNYTVHLVQGVEDFNQHSVFSVFPREAISCQLERDTSDPRIQHNIVLDQDTFGNVKRSVIIAYGRLPGKTSLTGMDQVKQEALSTLYSENDLTTVVDTPLDFRIPIVCESRSYEVSGIKPASDGGRFVFEDFAGVTGDFMPLDSLSTIPFESTNNSSLKQKRIIQRSRAFFRSSDLSELLPFGEVGPLAIPGTKYSLSFTPGLLTSVYNRNGIPLMDPQAVLNNGIGTTNLGFTDLENDGSWWSSGGRVYYSSSATANGSAELAEARSHFFKPLRFIDAFGNATTITYDDPVLLPVKVEDSIGNIVTATIDYRVLKHKLMIDPNGNQTAVAFDALGMVAGLAQMGKPNANEGDSMDNFIFDVPDADLELFFTQPKGSITAKLLANATTRTLYNVNRYQESKGPVFSAVISRVNHNKSIVSEADYQIQVSFSDGFGRVIQSKQQAKPGPLIQGGTAVPERWITSGWTVFNNKGDPVRQYEPFFDNTLDFKFNLKVGSASITIYDALSRKSAVLLPDHSFTKNITEAWSSAIWDANDTVKIPNLKADVDVGSLIGDLPEIEYLPSWYDSQTSNQYSRDAAQKSALHANTPRILHFDPQGRTILQLDDAGGNVVLQQRIGYDITGQRRQVYDRSDRLVETFDYSMNGDLIHQTNMEAGQSWTLPDTAQNPVLSWSARNFRFRHVYDSKRRLLEIWVSESGGAELLIEQHVYGETAPDADVHNLRDRMYQTRDQAGELQNDAFDFKGNLVASTRRVAKEYKQTVDWSKTPELDIELYSSAVTFDALNRPILSTSPDASQTYYVYNESAHVEKIFVNVKGEQQSQDPLTWTPLLTQADHNARNQLQTCTYGNGISIARTYHPLTFRLQRIQTSALGVSSNLQDLNYTFDATGNLTHIQDQAQQTIFFRNSRVDPSSDYTYDAVYRLIKATGREHLGQTNGQPSAPTPLGPFSGSISDSPTDGTAMGQYTEIYEYDDTGNVLSVTHAGSSANTPGWKRSFSYNESSLLQSSQKNNRLSATNTGSNGESYTYDAHGNMTSMPHLKSMTWDCREQLSSTSKQIVNNGDPETTYYVYDNGGNRIRKVTENAVTPNSGTTAPSRIKDRIYIGEWEVFRTFNPGNDSPALERTTLAVVSETKKMCRIHSRTIGTDNSPQRTVLFELDNHLGSVSLILDDQARLVSYEEYFPFGGTAYESTTNQNQVPKRYKYCGKEKDDETGLYYYGARYLAPWLCRWISTDPGGTNDGLNLYDFVHGNPVTLNDPDGRFAGVDDATAALIGGAAFLVAGTYVVITAQSGHRQEAARDFTNKVGDKIQNFRYKAHDTVLEYAGKVKDWVIEPEPTAPPEVTAPPTTAPPAPPTAPTGVPQVFAPPAPPLEIPIAVGIPVVVAGVRAKALTAKEREEGRRLIRELIKTIAGELEDTDIEDDDYHQHHIYPQSLYWFFKEFNLDIDAAENLVIMEESAHLKDLHGDFAYNWQWKWAISQLIDVKAYNDSKGKILEWAWKPGAGRRYTREEVGEKVREIGESWKKSLLLRGALRSPVRYLGADMKKYDRPEEFKL